MLPPQKDLLQEHLPIPLVSLFFITLCYMATYFFPSQNTSLCRQKHGLFAAVTPVLYREDT